MAKIYEHDIWYSLLRLYEDPCTLQSYRRTEVLGKENIPTDGAVIIAPNHCNTLLDALVVLCSRKGSTVFGARADLFKKYGKPLTFLKIVPMVRKRDGLREVQKNVETNEKLVEVLEHDVPFCIFSEGTHRPKHSLLPITKGVTRIALEANEKFGDRKPVYIVPAGLEYGDYFRFRSTSLLQYGQPINVTEFIKAHPEMSEAQIQMDLRAQIAQGISKLITFIDDDELYEPKWALTRMLTVDRKGSLKDKLDANKAAIEKINAFYSQHPEEAQALGEKAVAFDAERKKAGVSIKSFASRPEGITLAWKSLAAICGLPLALFFGIVDLPSWVMAEVLCRKVKDHAFHNTVKFVSKLALLPLELIIWAAVFFCTLPHVVLPLLLTISVFFAHGFVYDYAEFVRVLFSDWRLAFKPALKENFKELLLKLK